MIYKQCNYYIWLTIAWFWMGKCGNKTNLKLEMKWVHVVDQVVIYHKRQGIAIIRDFLYLHTWIKTVRSLSSEQPSSTFQQKLISYWIITRSEFTACSSSRRRGKLIPSPRRWTPARGRRRRRRCRVCGTAWRRRATRWGRCPTSTTCCRVNTSVCWPGTAKWYRTWRQRRDSPRNGGWLGSGKITFLCTVWGLKKGNPSLTPNFSKSKNYITKLISVHDSIIILLSFGTLFIHIRPWMAAPQSIW